MFAVNNSLDSCKHKKKRAEDPMTAKRVSPSPPQGSQDPLIPTRLDQWWSTADSTETYAKGHFTVQGQTKRL